MWPCGTRGQDVVALCATRPQRQTAKHQAGISTLRSPRRDSPGRLGHQPRGRPRADDGPIQGAASSSPAAQRPHGTGGNTGGNPRAHPNPGFPEDFPRPLPDPSPSASRSRGSGQRHDQDQDRTRHVNGTLPGTAISRIPLRRSMLSDVLQGNAFPRKAFLLTFVEARRVNPSAAIAPAGDGCRLPDVHYSGHARRAVGVKGKQHVISGEQDALIAG